MAQQRRHKVIIPFLFCMFFIAAGFWSTTRASGSDKPDTTDVYRNLKFRNIGPSIAGGRVTVVLGIPGKPNIYYVGAAGGGVWKTTNGGASWYAVFKKYPGSIGAMALAPSNPNLIWVGTGESNIRTDIIDGRGVYFSPDAGKTWKLMGLKDAGQISKIVVSPNDPNTVFVGAIGHAWGPNSERGLYKTTDGGKTWKKVLFVNDSTGVSDVIFKPGNPEVMFAGTWQVMRRPWTLIDGGNGSAVYRSTDGGDTWTKLTNGLPAGKLGRITLAPSPSNPDHIYAEIGSTKGVLWDTNDGGDSWHLITNNHALNVRPFYFSTMEVSPNNDKKIYFLSFRMSVSEDGGKTIKKLAPRVHVDYHAIWIDPTNPDRIIVGNDGGAYVSTNAGKNWHYFNNIPIEQFYQVATDTLTAYHLGGGLQDNNAWYGRSHNLHGGSVDGSTWFTVSGGDGEYVVPAPSNPNIIYSEAQTAYIKRTNLKTGVAHYIRPAVLSAADMPPGKLHYRFNWTTPFAVSYNDANTVYLGGNVLFKTTDGGKSWETISPDLTRNEKSKQVVAGGPIMHDISGAENYDTILSIGLSKQDPNVIWVGTDDGLIQVTRNGGKTWTNVTDNIPHKPKEGRFYQIDVSPFSPGTCYAAFDRHMMDDQHPYVYKTDDFGKHWKEIDKGLPDDMPVYVVREDPNHRGFLVLGNDEGLYYSRNDGDSSTRLKSNFPNVSVWDLKFVKKNHDLVVATHGRGLFILDDIRPLEEMNDHIMNSGFHFFSLQPAVMFNTSYHDNGLDTPETYSAPNPPSGAVIDYYLKQSIKPDSTQKKDHKTAVKIIITKANGDTVNTLYGPAKRGINRFTWNLNYKGATRLKSGKKPKNPNDTNGPGVLPGTYTVAVTVHGHTQKQTLTVRPDPSLPFDMEAARMQQQTDFQVQGILSTVNTMLNRINSLQDQIKNIRNAVQNQDEDGHYKQVLSKANKLDHELSAVKDSLMQTHNQKGVGEDDIHHLTRFRNWVMNGYAYGYNWAPTPYLRNYITWLDKKMTEYTSMYNNVVDKDLSAYNQSAAASNAPILIGGQTVISKQ